MPSRNTSPAWLWAVPIFSCGCLSPAAPLAIAIKLKTRSAWLWFGGFATAWVVSWAILGATPEGTNDALASLAVALFVLTAIGATVYSVVKAQEIHWGPPGGVPPHAPGTPYPYDPNSAAVAAVQAVRLKRQEAMAIVGRDPQMARDLRIGRPDLPRHFDDGGLVDINSAPSEALMRGLGLTEAQATQVLEARHHIGRFQSSHDLMHLAGIDLATHQQIEDRIVLL